MLPIICLFPANKRLVFITFTATFQQWNSYKLFLKLSYKIKFLNVDLNRDPDGVVDQLKE